MHEVAPRAVRMVGTSWFVVIAALVTVLVLILILGVLGVLDGPGSYYLASSVPSRLDYTCRDS